MSAAIAGMVSTEVARWRKRVQELEGRQLGKRAQAEDLTDRHGRLIAIGDDDAAARKVGALARAVEAELIDIAHGLDAAGAALATAKEDAAVKARQVMVDELDQIMSERGQIAAKCDRGMRTLARQFQAMADLAARAEALQGHTVNRDNPLNVSAVINRSTLFAGGLGLDHWLRSIPEKGTIAVWPESFASDELKAQENYLGTEEGG